MIGILGFILLIGLGGYSGYSAGIGDRKDAEMTIFTMKDGKLTPVAVIKGGQTTAWEDFLKAAVPAPAAEAPKSEAMKEEAKK